MNRFRKLKQRVKNPLQHIKKVKNVRWLIPGWVFYEYYKLHKGKGFTKRISFVRGAKAEIFRLAATASLPVPGTYELTTTGLALIKTKIENDEINKLTLKAFKDFAPLRNLKINKSMLRGQPYLRIYMNNKKIHFEIFYKKKN